MSLYCMESLGRRYQEADETYDLFKKVLIDYLPFANEGEKLKVNELHNEYFVALDILYSTACATPIEELNDSERLADSLAFYKASGLLFMNEGQYYIDTNKLKAKFLEYQSYKENKKTSVYSKGPKK